MNIMIRRTFSTMVDKLKGKLQPLAPTHLTINDDNPSQPNSYMRMLIVSKDFSGKTLL